ncbi:MAG: hypothetical protein RID53_25850 [Coleofasciculus sp. B1-GNL1-01]|uniref:hypothetical protein n=1 Tax=Coleofasciculus sp. B1-GNL1-01 TaxID=3068484 RepID=UPI00330463DF
MNSAIKQQIFVIFLSPAPFYSNPARSFLKYLQKNTPSCFKLVNFPKNLYTASESLAEDFQPLTPSLQFPDRTQHPVVITITPRQNDSAMLTLNLGGADIARQLLGEQADNASITWLIDILCTGARMTRADCGFVSWEAQPNETINARVEYGRLYLEKLPIMLWTTAPLSKAISHLSADAWKTEQQSDGACLIIPQRLPENQNTGDKDSLWIDVTQTRYFLIPSRQEIPGGNFQIYNLEGEQKKVAIAKIASYEITQEQATAYLESQINQAIDQAKDALFNQITFSIGKSPETPRQTTTLSELMAVLLGVSPEELPNHPERAKVSLEKLIATFKDIIGGSLSKDSARLDVARQQMHIIQTNLKAHGIDLGNTLEQFPDKLHNLHFSAKSAASLHQMTANLRKFADQIDKISDNKERSFKEVMTAFANAYRDLFGKEDEAQAQARLQQEYRKMADEAITESLNQHPMPSLKFEDLLPKSSQKPDEST